MSPYQALFRIFLIVICSPVFAADPIYSLNSQKFTQCSNVPTTIDLPDFSLPNCTSVKFHDIDPQGHELWLHTDLPDEILIALHNKPLGLYLMGKAASVIYLNGHRIGENGQPNASAINEAVGKMDHVFYLPRERLKAQNNELVIHLSGHKSYIDLSYPMHFIGLAEFGDSRRFIQSHSALGLIFVGMFVLSSIYLYQNG